MSTPAIPAVLLAIIVLGVIVVGLIAFLVLGRAFAPSMRSTPPPRAPRPAAMNEDEVLYLAILENDGKIAAIKAYREATGLDLKSAKEAIDALEAGARLPARGQPATPPRGPRNDTHYLSIIEKEGKLSAIKSYREDTGCGLRDAKDAIDKLAAGDRIPTSKMPAMSPSESANFEEEVCRLVRAGKHNDAVALYRSRHGGTHQEASDAIGRILREAL